MNQWYIIKTKPFKEIGVQKLFTQADIETFSPKMRDINYRRQGMTSTTKSLFPTYIFIHIDFDISENIHLIKYTRGVSRILCAEGRPLPVGEKIIQAIKMRSNSEGVIEMPIRLKPGDKIRVKKGILKDLMGIMEKRTSDNERIIVLLKLINYEMRATLHWAEIETLQAA